MFTAPAWLVLVPVVVATASVVILRERRHRTAGSDGAGAPAGTAPAPDGRRRARRLRPVPIVLFAAAIVLQLLGLAGLHQRQQVARETATIMLAIDTSLSMEATDVAPSRFSAAKVAAGSFLDAVPARIDVGLVAFSRTAREVVSPTTDRARLRLGLDRLQLGESTAIGDAIFACLKVIAGLPPDAQGLPPLARIVLLSDGKTTQGRPDEAAIVAAVNAGVPVTTIAFGTDGGAITIPAGSGGDAAEAGGRAAVPVDREALRRIADRTGGDAFTAATGAELISVYEDIGSSVAHLVDGRDLSAWCFGAALALLGLVAVLSIVGGRVEAPPARGDTAAP